MFAIRAKAGHDRTLKNVLTAKKARFLSVLAGKQGFGAGKKDDSFALFQVFVVLCVCKLLSGSLLQMAEGSKKIVPEILPWDFVFSGVVP